MRDLRLGERLGLITGLMASVWLTCLTRLNNLVELHLTGLMASILLTYNRDTEVHDLRN